MRKRAYVILIFRGLSAVALVISIVALCRVAPRLNDSGLAFDYMGVIVGVLSILVTALLGWNIYQVIDIRSIKNDFDLIRREAARINNKAFDASSRANHSMYLFFRNNEQYPGAVTSLILCLSDMIESDLISNVKEKNIDRNSENLKECVQEMIARSQEFGDNNIGIIKRALSTIKENENYDFIHKQYCDLFEKIESAIVGEDKMKAKTTK